MNRTTIFGLALMTGSMCLLSIAVVFFAFYPDSFVVTGLSIGAIVVGPTGSAVFMWGICK